MTDEEAIKELQEIKAAIDNVFTFSADRKRDALDLATKALEHGPKGEWTDESQESLKCSACGMRVYKPFIGGFPTERTRNYWPNFCAFCGADMRKEGEP